MKLYMGTKGAAHTCGTEFLSLRSCVVRMRSSETFVEHVLKRF